MKKLSVLLTILWIVGLLAGCAGTPVVYYSDCTCPTGSHTVQKPVLTEGSVKTGLYIGASVKGSKNAAGETAGKVAYDVTVVAVTVDDSGVIHSCVIDSVPATVEFDAAGVILSDCAAPVRSKNEMGTDYGMKNAGSKYEWNEQAQALADYAVGKTLEELKNGALDETGHAADADLASMATIYLGGYLAGIEGAVANAQHLGAQAGDTLRLATIGSLKSSKDGQAQLDLDVTALTEKDGVITSCCLDSLQGKVAFDASGSLITDVNESLRTKNQLGADYGMKNAGAKYEWNEQAASFAAYVTGKTAAEVAGIAVSEGKAADADLAATVTVAIGGFQALIAKAMQ